MFKCDWEGCDREFKTQGALNLHKRQHEIKQYRESKKEQKKEIHDHDEEKCDHAYRFLNLSVKSERAAAQKNYREVCKKCLNLR
jgi:hypothetical protein